MGQLVATKFFGALRGLFSALDVSDENLIKNTLIRPKASGHVTDGGTAGTAQTETWVWQNTTGNNMRVVQATVTAPIAVTADPANNATFTVTKRDAAGINPAVVATNVTTAGGTGSLVAFLPVALPLTVANVIVPAGGQLTVLMSKAGTGVAVAAATSQARIEILLEPAD